MTSNIVKQVIDIVKDLERVGEVVTGTSEDREISEKITSYFEELGLECRKYEIEVLSWREKHLDIEFKPDIKVNDGITLLPYSLTSTFKLKLEYDARKDLVGRAIIVEASRREVDDVKDQYLDLAEKGAELIVFYDPYPGHKIRRIVLTGVRDYRFTAASPPTSPAIWLSREDGLKILEKAKKDRVEIIGDIEVEVKHSAVGVIVETEVEGKYDDEVIIGVHHDHWFKGVGDNLASIALIISLVKQLVNPKYTVKIVSFTAEESGAPGFSPWYWAYGSRKYLEILGENKLDKIKLAIILDTITKTPLTISSIDLEVEELCEEIVRQHREHTIIDYLTPDTDAVSFALKGIPTICIHAIPQFLPIYHTQQDDIEGIEPEALKTTAKILKTIIREIDRYLDKPEKYLKKLCERLKIKVKAHRRAYEDKKNFRRRKREINKITYILYTEQYIKGVEKDERFHFTRGIEGRITQRLNEIEEIISLVEKGKINIAREKLEEIPVEIKIPGYETPIFTLNINQILELLCKNRKKTCISILSETLNIYKTLAERISQKTKRNIERIISSEEPPKTSYMDILY